MSIMYPNIPYRMQVHLVRILLLFFFLWKYNLLHIGKSRIYVAQKFVQILITILIDQESYCIFVQFVIPPSIYLTHLCCITDLQQILLKSRFIILIQYFSISSHSLLFFLLLLAFFSFSYYYYYFDFLIQTIRIIILS